jgi:ComF family protein
VAILDILFPKRCINCKKFGEYVCVNCFTQFSFDSGSMCLVCGNASMDGLTHPICRGKYVIDGAFCGFSYKGITKRAIYVLKYQPHLFDIATMLSDLLYESLIQQERFMGILQKREVALIPIPLSSKKLRSRGYNQSKLLADKFGKKFSIPVIDFLQRTFDTKPQYALKREERKINVKGAFKINEKRKVIRDKEKVIFIVDDVLTTGSTLLEAANVLKRNGFEKVYGMCFARDY